VFHLQASRIHSVFTQPFKKDTKRVQPAVQGKRRTRALFYTVSYKKMCHFVFDNNSLTPAFLG